MTKTINLLAMLLVLTLFLDGCAVDHYKEIGVAYGDSKIAPSPNRSAVIFMEPVFVGKRFDEVTCDNIVGVVWNPEEAKKIGYTANIAEGMAKILPLMALEATLPYNIGTGRVASGQSPISLNQIKVDGRILVPLGSYIARHVEHASSNLLGRSSVCYDSTCVERHLQSHPTDVVATVRFTKFRVAEEKANRLTLVAEGTSIVNDPSGSRHEIPLKYEIIERSVTSQGGFSGDIVQTMAKMTSELSFSIAEQVVASVQ
jgi:hypothetical protein